ncbi:MAG: glycosyltransferase [Bacteroidetes bacterium]|nr:glycosyltransferase [Bacteroidota bacterium]
MNPPLVSIVIPTYNRPEHLERALESALRQTYENLEIIVVDDGSELNLKLFEKTYPSVRFLKNKTNRGPCYSRNRGLKASNGEYINFLDDDDELYPNKIKLQVEKFLESDDPNLGMVTCHLLDRRSGKEKLVQNKVQGNIYKKMLSGFAVAGTEAMLFKKSVFDEIDGFDEALESSQEYDLFIRAAEVCAIDYVDQVLTRKNRSENQISLNFDKKISGATHLFKKHNERYMEVGFFFKMRMRVKLYGLVCRFLIGKWFGEKAYRCTIRD